MFNVVLFEPEIPPNTGNIIRLCANSGHQLHLIHPLGFDLSSKQCRRAGLDYHEFTHIKEHSDYKQWRDHGETSPRLQRIFACTTKGTAHYTDYQYQPGDSFIFGPETRGLPDSILNDIPASQHIKIPMKAHSRSLNLSNSVAIILYEAWRQQEFKQEEQPLL